MLAHHRAERGGDGADGIGGAIAFPGLELHPAEDLIGHRIEDLVFAAEIVEYPFQGTIATTDGESLWVFRYSSQGKSRSLFFTRDVRTLRQQYPDREILREVSDDARLVVSEPIGDLPGAWIEMPEASYGVVSKGGDQLLPFVPKPPQNAA